MGLKARRRQKPASDVSRFVWDGPLVFEDPETTKAWDESKHPRRPKGDERGGEFTEVGVVPESGGHPITGGSDAGPRALLARMAEEAKAGGFTYNPRTGRVPTEGFSVGVALDDKSTASFDVDTFSVEDVEAFWKANADRMADKRMYVGGWLDNGKVWLDLTRVYPTDMRDVAINIGRKRNQIAIADLGAIGRGDWDHAFVSTGGTGAVVKAGLDSRGKRGDTSRRARAQYFLFEPGASAREVHAAIMAAARVAKAWDESKHPRHPAGSEQGGEFAPADMAAGAASAATGSGSGGNRSPRAGEYEDLGLTPEQLELSDHVMDTYNPALGMTYGEVLVEGLKLPQTIEDNSPERQAHRIDVARRYMAERGWDKTPKGRHFDFVMGVPGAGKSSMVQGAQDEFQSFHIDQDAIKTMLDGYRGGLGAMAVHAEAAQISDALVAKALKEGRNIVVEGTGKTLANAQALVDQVKARGYRVRLHVVDLHSEAAIRRAGDRFIRTGRPVPIRMMWKMGGAQGAGKPRTEPTPLKNFRILAKQKGVIDEAIHWDNNVRRGQPARRVSTLIRKGDDGRRGAAPRGADAGERARHDLRRHGAEPVSREDPRPVPRDPAHPARGAHRVVKLNPYHEPKGTPVGGQFANAPGVEDHEQRATAYARAALRMRARAAEHLARGGSADHYDRMIAFADSYARRAAKYAGRAHAGWRERRAAAESLFGKGMLTPGDVHVDTPLGSEAPAKRRRRTRAGQNPADQYEIGPILQEALKALRESDGYVPMYKAVGEDQRIVCGWASIIAEPDGTPIVDRHGEVIEEHELVLAEREYMRHHRILGKGHQLFDGQGEVLESLVVTKQAKRDLGLPEYVPIGWLIAAKVWNDDTWAAAKAGDLPAFSIGGSARPEPYHGAGG